MKNLNLHLNLDPLSLDPNHPKTWTRSDSRIFWLLQPQRAKTHLPLSRDVIYQAEIPFVHFLQFERLLVVAGRHWPFIEVCWPQIWKNCPRRSCLPISSSVYEEVVPNLKMDSSLSAGSISEWVPNEVFSNQDSLGLGVITDWVIAPHVPRSSENPGW